MTKQGSNKIDRKFLIAANHGGFHLYSSDTDGSVKFSIRNSYMTQNGGQPFENSNPSLDYRYFSCGDYINSDKHILDYCVDCLNKIMENSEHEMFSFDGRTLDCSSIL